MDARTLADSIKTAVTAREAAIRYGFEPDRFGKLCCPFHSEKTPSMIVRNNGRGFICFGCHASGSVIDFVCKLFDISFIESCRKINADFGLNLPIDKPSTASDRRAAFEMERKREAERMRIQKLEDDYWRAFDFWRVVSVWYTDNQPKTPDEEWSALFILALRWRSIAKFNLEEAAWAMSRR